MIIMEDRKCKIRSDDWVCTDPLCGNVNYAWRKVCNKCRKNRDEFVPPMINVIGKNAAEKSEGIFKSEDWQCKKCGNVNWARGQSCNRCETSKFDPINMISPEEVMDNNEDNVSVHSSMSSLNSPPVDADSGIGSCDEMVAQNGSERKKPVWLFIDKILTEFVGLSEKEGNVIVDKEVVRDFLITMMIGSCLNQDRLPESDELAKLNIDERLRLLVSRCDLPPEIKESFSALPLSEVKQVVFASVASCLSKRSANTKESSTESPHPSTPSVETSVVPQPQVPQQTQLKQNYCDMCSTCCMQSHCDRSQIPTRENCCNTCQMSSKQHGCERSQTSSNLSHCNRTCTQNHCDLSQMSSTQNHCDLSQMSSTQNHCDLSRMSSTQQCDRPQVPTEKRRVVLAKPHRSSRSRSHSPPQELRKIIYRGPRRSQSPPSRRHYSPSSRSPYYRSGSRHREGKERTRDNRQYPYKRYSRPSIQG